MKDVRTILSPLLQQMSLKRAIRQTGKKLVLPFYHAISDIPPAHIRHLYRVKSQREFNEDLEQILKYYEPASPAIFKEGRASRYAGKPAFVLSFDDGFSEVAEIIVPLLEKKGINAIFFLNNNFIDNRELFYRCKVSLLIDGLYSLKISRATLKELASMMSLVKQDRESVETGLRSLKFRDQDLIDRQAELLGIDFNAYLQEKRPYLEDRQIRSLLGKGFYVGAHSHQHSWFPHMTPGEQLEEITDSVEDIRNAYNLDYNYFSFPFTDTGIGQEVFSGLYSGAEPKLDASFGTSGLKDEENFPHFQRIPLEKSALPAEQYLRTEYFYYRIKSLVARNRILRPGKN